MICADWLYWSLLPQKNALHVVVEGLFITSMVAFRLVILVMGEAVNRIPPPKEAVWWIAISSRPSPAWRVTAVTAKLVAAAEKSPLLIVTFRHLGLVLAQAIPLLSVESATRI